jgi:hypothetical protein
MAMHYCHWITFISMFPIYISLALRSLGLRPLSLRSLALRSSEVKMTFRKSPCIYLVNICFSRSSSSSMAVAMCIISFLKDRLLFGSERSLRSFTRQPKNPKVTYYLQTALEEIDPPSSSVAASFNMYWDLSTWPPQQVPCCRGQWFFILYARNKTKQCKLLCVEICKLLVLFLCPFCLLILLFLVNSCTYWSLGTCISKEWHFCCLLMICSGHGQIKSVDISANNDGCEQ